MDIKKKKQIVLILSLVLLVVGYVLDNSVSFGLCEITERGCKNFLNYNGHIIFTASQFILAISFILLFVKDKVFELWQKFAVWYLPIVAILIWLIPEPGSGDFLAPSNIMFTKWFFWLYALISLILIIYKTLKLKNKPHLEAKLPSGVY